MINHRLRQLSRQFPLFLMLGIAIALTIGIFILFAYVLFWGILFGGILWLVALIKQYFFRKRQPQKHKGRVIDHDPKN